MTKRTLSIDNFTRRHAPRLLTQTESDKKRTENRKKLQPAVTVMSVDKDFTCSFIIQ